jgi:hypothetical protein
MGFDPHIPDERMPHRLVDLAQSVETAELYRSSSVGIDDLDRAKIGGENAPDFLLYSVRR